MKAKEKLSVGTVLYYEEDYIYKDGKPVIGSAIIRAIEGNKYDLQNGLKCRASDLRYVDPKYSHRNKQFYRTRQEVLDKCEIANLAHDLFILCTIGDHKKLSLETLREIDKLIKNGKDNNR